MPMANLIRPPVTHRAPVVVVLLLLIVFGWLEMHHCSGLEVDPPENVAIVDTGHLGHLEVTWSPPASLVNATECPTLYQLEYFSADAGKWIAIRTSRMSYRAQFDLTKGIRVRVYTLRRTPCPDGTLAKSASYAELVQKPPSTGVAGTRVKDFFCVFYKMEVMECTWARGTKTSAKSQENLYFWHKELEQTEECPKYMLSDGVRIGCDLTDKTLPTFTDVNFCINGSTPEGPLEPTFVSLQIQNHVKPGPTEKLYLLTGPDTRLEVRWDFPTGSVPRHCLEWEVEQSQEGADGKIATKRISAVETSLTLPLSHHKERRCFRVRSKLDKYCADKSFWSEWSHQQCHPEIKNSATGTEGDMAQVYEYVAVASAAALVLSLCMGTLLKVWCSRRAQNKQDPLCANLFRRISRPLRAKDQMPA